MNGQYVVPPALLRRGNRVTQDRVLKRAAPGTGTAATHLDIRQYHQQKIISWNQGISLAGSNLQIVGFDTVGE